MVLGIQLDGCIRQVLAVLVKVALQAFHRLLQLFHQYSHGVPPHLCHLQQ